MGEHGAAGTSTEQGAMQRTLISSKSAEGGCTVPPVRPFSRCFFLAETSSAPMTQYFSINGIFDRQLPGARLQQQGILLLTLDVVELVLQFVFKATQAHRLGAF